MIVSKIPRWVDFVVSELTINELEEFEETLKNAIAEKNRILFEQPLSAHPRKFRGMKIEDATLTIRTKNLLFSKKYKTLEQLAKLSRNQIFSLLKSKKSTAEIIFEVADDQTIGSREIYESLRLKLSMENKIT